MFLGKLCLLDLVPLELLILSLDKLLAAFSSAIFLSMCLNLTSRPNKVALVGIRYSFFSVDYFIKQARSKDEK